MCIAERKGARAVVNRESVHRPVLDARQSTLTEIHSHLGAPLPSPTLAVGERLGSRRLTGIVEEVLQATAPSCREPRVAAKFVREGVDGT